MYSIEIDFDVYKKLTLLRETESMSYNDVLRDVFKLGPTRAKQPEVLPPSSDDWVVKGVRFPAGTEFRVTYKGKTYTAFVEGGALKLNGNRFESPSKAAMSITNNAVNGWRFWECRFPGKSVWQLMDSIRGN